MLRGLILFAAIQLVHMNHLIDPFSFYTNPADVAQFTYDFFNIFDKLRNFNVPPTPEKSIVQDPLPSIFPIFSSSFIPDVSKQQPPAFKTVVMNDLRPGTQKVFSLNNGKGIAFRSKDGNSGGMSFSSGNGNGFAFGGTLSDKNNGEFVMSQSMPGAPGKVMYKKGMPDFAKQLFRQFSFLNI